MFVHSDNEHAREVLKLIFETFVGLKARAADSTAEEIIDNYLSKPTECRTHSPLQRSSLIICESTLSEWTKIKELRDVNGVWISTPNSHCKESLIVVIEVVIFDRNTVLFHVQVAPEGHDSKRNEFSFLTALSGVGYSVRKLKPEDLDFHRASLFVRSAEIILTVGQFQNWTQ